MPTKINTNMGAMNAMRYIGLNDKKVSLASDQLSSGSLVSDPSNAPARAAVGSAMDAKIRSLKQAATTTSQATAMVQLAIGALASTNDILIQMQDLAAQAQSGSIGDAERNMLDKEFQALASQITSNSKITWGTTSLLGGGIPVLTAIASPTVTAPVSADNGINLSISCAVASSDTANGTGVYYPAAGSDISATTTYQIDYQSTESVFTLKKTTADGEISLKGMLSPSFDPQSATPIDEIIYFADGSSLKLTGFSTNPDAGAAHDMKFAMGTGTVPAANTAFSLNDPANLTSEIPNSLILTFQTGAGFEENIDIAFPSLTLENIGIAGQSIENLANATSAKAAIDAALRRNSQAIAELGSKKSQMGFAFDNIQVAIANQSAAKATFTDADIEESLLMQKLSGQLLQASMATFQSALERQGSIARLISETLRT